MARGNRFTPRNALQDVQRRQAQARGETLAQNERRPRREERYTPEQQVRTDTDWITNNTFATDYNTWTARTNNTWFNTNVATGTTNIDMATIRPRGERITTTAQEMQINAQAAEQRLRTTLEQMTAAPEEPGIMFRNIDPAPEFFQQTNDRTVQRRRVNNNYRVGNTSRIKAKGFQQRYLAVMALGLNYRGISFSYAIDPSKNIGRWFLSSMVIAEVELDTVRLSKLIYPVVPEAYGNVAKMYNKIRFLWRQLGLQAIRYKNKTVVHTGRSGCVLKPGDEWIIKPQYIDPFIGESRPEPEQQDLIPDLVIPGKFAYKLKPTTWTRINGKGFAYQIIRLPDGTDYNLNNPPQPPAENILSASDD